MVDVNALLLVERGCPSAVPSVLFEIIQGKSVDVRGQRKKKNARCFFSVTMSCALVLDWFTHAAVEVLTIVFFLMRVVA